jgi:hypothetical protein
MKGEKHRDALALPGDDPEFRRLRRAVDKAGGDRERAIKNICRLYGVKMIDALPSTIRAAAVALIGDPGSPNPRFGPI